VAPGESGLRLDVLLARRLGISRARARRLLDRGAVTVDGRAASLRGKAALPGPGARVAVSGPLEAAGERLQPEPEAPLALLAEGPGWVAVDKPAGVAVHPLRPDERGSVLAALAARRPEVLGVGEAGLRSGVVHRLDVGTSGVLLFALAGDAWLRLREAFRAHRVSKRYRAVVRGRLEGAGREESWLRVTQRQPARVRVVAPGTPGARPARLWWRALAGSPAHTLLEVGLETGHLHQIRVSLAARGHPVLGDPLYGPPPQADPLDGPPADAERPASRPGEGRRGEPGERMLLHAARVAIPELGVEAASPDPPALAAALARLGLATQG